jgi:rRNA maturation RNase YbeY
LEHDAVVTIRVVAQEEGRALNRNYRKKDYATNVLTFVFHAERNGVPFEGDLVLCAPVVTREARAQKKTAVRALRAFNRPWHAALTRLRPRRKRRREGDGTARNPDHGKIGVC